MNKSQIDQITAHIDTFFTLELSQKIAEHYPDTPDINDVSIGNYTAKEFLSLSNKVFDQFKEELSQSLIKALPFQYHFQNEYGNGNLNDEFQQYINHVKGNNFPAAANNLNKLIHYQAINGFWEKSKRKYFKSYEAKVQEDQERIDLTSRHLNEVSIKLKSVVENLESEKDALSTFTRAKKKELDEISSLVASARQHNDEINNLNTSSVSVSEKINALHDASEEKKTDIDELFKELKNEQKNLGSLINDRKDQIEDQNKKFTQLDEKFSEKLSIVNDKTEFFEERNRYLDDLIGREVGASLFETFNQRKSELKKPIIIWGIAVAIAAAITVWWISQLFGGIDPSNIPWQLIVINTIKSLPALGFLLFTISQYSKERHFQEEYAFKSAVALTVNSYAEQLKDESNKDSLIMESVSEIYTTPIDKKPVKKSDDVSILKATKDLIDSGKAALKG